MLYSPFYDRPKNLEIYEIEKICIKAFKTEKYRPKDGVKKKVFKSFFFFLKISDRPTHVWHLKVNTTSFFLGDGVSVQEEEEDEDGDDNGYNCGDDDEDVDGDNDDNDDDSGSGGDDENQDDDIIGHNHGPNNH